MSAKACLFAWSFFLVLPLARAVDAPLEGEWRQACGQGHQSTERFHGDSAELIETTFMDSACSRPALAFYSRGRIALGGSVAELTGARILDFAFVAVAVVVQEPSWIVDYNRRAVCGWVDWAVGQEREVTGRECDFLGPGSSLRAPAAGEWRYGVASWNEQELFFGKLTPENNALSPEARPTELDPRAFFRVSAE